MKKICLLLFSFFILPAAFAQPQMNAGLAIMCYNEAAIQASLALSAASAQASDSDALRLKERQSRLLQANEALMMSEAACAANSPTENLKNNCIRENYTRSAVELVVEFNLQHLKSSDEACSLILP